MILTDKEKKRLKTIGQTFQGTEMADILNGIKARMSTVDDITDNYGAQVEGRKIFNEIVKEIVAAIHSKDRPRTRRDEDVDDFT